LNVREHWRLDEEVERRLEGIEREFRQIFGWVKPLRKDSFTTFDSMEAWKVRVYVTYVSELSS
jgi:hypothetical protein